jgi:hypothetical protein
MSSGKVAGIVAPDRVAVPDCVTVADEQLEIYDAAQFTVKLEAVTDVIVAPATFKLVGTR